MLSDEAVQKYKKVFKKAYGVDLDNEEATEMANDLFNFMEAVYLPVEDEELITKHNNEPRYSNQ